jgi:hypothetical protein
MNLHQHTIDADKQLLLDWWNANNLGARYRQHPTDPDYFMDDAFDNRARLPWQEMLPPIWDTPLHRAREWNARGRPHIR